MDYFKRGCWAFVVAIAIAFDTAAEPIVVSNYGVGASGIPYAVAMEKGFFKQLGADVDRIISVDGDIAVRTLMEMKLAYGEVALPAVITARERGADVLIVSDNVPLVVDYVWVALASSSIASVKDMKGRRLGFSATGSTDELLSRLWIAKAGVPATDVTFSRVGSMIAGTAFLERNAIDVIAIEEPMYIASGAKYKKIDSAADVVPVFNNAVGITSREALTSKRAFLHAVLAARSMAIEHMRSYPADAAVAVAHVYKLEPSVAEAVIRRLLDEEKTYGRPFWAQGAIGQEAMNGSLDVRARVYGNAGKVDVDSMIDRSLFSVAQQATPSH
jgi:NitT/TauT family transport system substrate-binding protein